MLWVAPDLQNPVSELGEGDGEVGRGRALANPPLAINRKHLRGADLDVGIELDLD